MKATKTTYLSPSTISLVSRHKESQKRHAIETGSKFNQSLVYHRQSILYHFFFIRKIAKKL